MGKYNIFSLLNLNGLMNKFSRRIFLNFRSLHEIKKSRNFSTDVKKLTKANYDVISESTLNKISDIIEQYSTKHNILPNLDTSLESSTLTIILEPGKVYVLNK